VLVVRGLIERKESAAAWQTLRKTCDDGDLRQERVGPFYLAFRFFRFWHGFGQLSWVQLLSGLLRDSIGNHGVPTGQPGPKWYAHRRDVLRA